VSAFLDSFYAEMGAFFFDHPDDPQVLVDHFDGWDAEPKRVAIYGRFVQNHVADTVASVYSACREATDDAVWKRWSALYYATRPSQSWRINQVAEPFAAFVAAQPDAPPFLSALARFEWEKLLVYHAQTPIPKAPTRLVANPTLTFLEHPWHLCAYYRSREGTPAAGDEVALIWRNPTSRLVRYQAANARTLLAIKMAMEEISVADAAAAGGVEPKQVEVALDEAVERGLLLAPASS
jgi:hypothetical protein